MASTRERPKVFAREATGLVRRISVLDAFLANLGFISIALGLLTYTSSMYVFPGSDAVLATLLATVFCVIASLMYTLFAWAMPRSGGDYVLMSRGLHPLLGFVVSFHFTFWVVFMTGVFTNWVTTLAIAPSILILGTVTSNPFLIGVANGLDDPNIIVMIGLIVIAAVTALMVRGIRATFTVNNILNIVGLVGVAIVIVLLVSSTNADFVNAFSRFGSYDGVISAAQAAGYSPEGPNPFIATLGVMPFVFASIGFGVITASFAGEVKSAKKNLLYSQLGSTIVAGIFLAVLGALAVGVFGYKFLGSITALDYSGAKEYPFSSPYVPSFFNLFASILTKNALLLWVLAIGYVASLIVLIMPASMIGTRNIFAWSFDRVIPTKLSTINERFHTPVYAIITVVIIQLVGLVSYTYAHSTAVSIVAGGGVAEIISFIVVAVAATVFPFRKKELYKSSPANINVGPIPLISILGIISFLFYLLLEFFYFTNPVYGAISPLFLNVVAFSLLAPIVIYVVSYFHRKSKGIPLSMAFKEIPPE
jgi:amino acid transporter